jgi:hypothetical protein
MKVVNLSPSREIEITHIWFDTHPPVHIDNRARPLPARLRLGSVDAASDGAAGHGRDGERRP